SLATNLGYSGLFVVGLTLLTLGWLRAGTRPLTLKRALGATALVHAAALLVPTFLSMDTTCYAAIGRAMAVFHHSAYRPLVESLPPGDPFLSNLLPQWRVDTSAYGPAFNEFAQLISVVARDSLTANLRGFQLLAALAVLGATALVGMAFD